MLVDLRTMLLVFVCTLLIFVLLFVVIAYRHPKLQGPRYWAASCLAQAIGMLLLGMRGSIPDVSSIVVGNGLLFGGAVISWVGLRAFLGLPPRSRLIPLTTLPVTALIAVYTLWEPSIVMRQAGVALASFVVLVLTSRDILRNIRPGTRLESHALAGFLLFGALLHLLRIAAVMFIPATGSEFASTPVDGVIALAFFTSGAGRLIMFLPLMFGYLQEQRRIAEQAASQSSAMLKDSELHLKAVLDNAPDAMITTDEHGIIESINIAAEKTFGYPAAELIGQSIDIICPRAGYLGTATVSPSEMAIERPNGTRLMVELAVSVVNRGQRQITIGIFHDVSERHRITTMKNEFISIVSHELRTPLTSIRGALGLMSSGVFGPLPGKMAELTRVANDNSVRLSALIDDILDVERLEYGGTQIETQPHAVRPLVEQAVAANQGLASQQRVALALQADDRPLTIQVADNRFIQILTNLISNAVKFSPAEETVHISIAESAGVVRIAIIDHGPGIPLDFRDRIFQKFAQADTSTVRSNVGTGLGLSIARGLAERMGGRIGFDSIPSQGAMFYVEFPLVGANA